MAAIGKAVVLKSSVNGRSRPRAVIYSLTPLFNVGDHREPKGLRQFHLWQERSSLRTWQVG